MMEDTISRKTARALQAVEEPEETTELLEKPIINTTPSDDEIEDIKNELTTENVDDKQVESVMKTNGTLKEKINSTA